MLIELECSLFGSCQDEKFTPYGKIKFHKGLNTILGTKNGDNSIGKSTFLMVIDFCFGGEDYANIKNKGCVIPYVGTHTINFAFEFDGKIEYYSRATDAAFHVNVCDSDYQIQRTITLEEFKEHLFQAYQIQLSGISFREIVGRYIRAAGRENCDSPDPLKYQDIPDDKAIITLEKLFNVYSLVESCQKDFDEKEKRRKGWKAVSDLGEVLPIPKTATAFKKNQKEIEILQDQLQSLKAKKDTDISLGESTIVQKTANLKADLRKIKRNRNYYISRLENLKNNLKEGFVPTSEDIDKLAEFFPDVNLERLNMIENFHAKINQFLTNDITEEVENLQIMIAALNEQIQKTEEELHQMGELANFSEKTLQEIIDLQRKIDTLKKANAGYETFKQIAEDTKQAKTALENIREKQLNTVQSLVNQELVRYNDFIYHGTRYAPQIIFSSTKTGKASYTFGVPQDNGTGTSWKNVVIFDLSILKLTPLPILAHDTPIMKNIGDFPVDEIIQLYMQFEKQIFITFDKTESYSEETHKILHDTKVLELYDNGGELFGWSWAKKSGTNKTIGKNST